MTDIYGASPSNLAMKLLDAGRIEGRGGVNLPMLLRPLTTARRVMRKSATCLWSLEGSV